MQAVVRIGTSQYFVSPDQEILVNHLARPEKNLTFNEVLLVVDGQNVQVGRPFVPGYQVTATLVGEVRGDKIRVAKFKAKSRYRKSVGFRALYSRIKIVSISETSATTKDTNPTEVKPKSVRKTVIKKSV